MLPVFDDFTASFAEFMESGQYEILADYCDLGTDLEFFNIYRNGYYRSAIDSMGSNYPAVLALLGEDYFRGLAKQYVTQFPPSAGSLVGYGGEFASFLAEHDISQQLPYLSDVAKLDRAWLNVYFAAENAPITVDEISTLMGRVDDIAMHQLELCTAIDIVSLDYAVTPVWQILKETGRLNTAIEVIKKPEYVLLWRQHSEVLIRPLTSVEFKFLSGLNTGLNLGEAAEIAVLDDSDFNLSEFFSNLITAGLLATTQKLVREA